MRLEDEIYSGAIAALRRHVLKLEGAVDDGTTHFRKELDDGSEVSAVMMTPEAALALTVASRLRGAISALVRDAVSETRSSG